MIKVIDIDRLFDNYIAGYVHANIGKVKPEEIENNIPVLYEKFGDEKIKELDGETPNSFYKKYSPEELILCLKEHLAKKVPPSDFLCEAIRDGDSEDALCKALNEENEEEFTLYLMNILNDKNSSEPIKRYLEFIMWDYGEPIREFATELLCGFADEIKEDVLSQYKEAEKEKKDCLTEILSHCKKDDRVFDILIDQFVKNGDKIFVYAGYLGRYGDERALPFLLTAIENDKIDYGDFEELRFAIEALGGEYDKKRDFSHDKVYKKIKDASKTNDKND